MALRLPSMAAIWSTLFFFLTNAPRFAGSDATEQMLYTRLMHGYEKDVRPTRHHSVATNVTFGFLLQMVVDVDEKNQVLTSRSWLNINWQDHRLAWNSSLYQGIKILHIPYKRLWRPDIILSNNADPEYQEAVVSTDIFLTPAGNVSWLSSAIFRSSCQMKVRYYPFDDQECNMTFASWSYHGEEINLKLLTEEGDLSSYAVNSEFQLMSLSAKRLTREFSCCPGKPWPVITIIIRLKRRPLFYVFNHILPCVLISSMAILGFYVPPDTGEKVTMCITTMLSMGVYLKTITEIIPPTSEAVPLIGVYYVVSLAVVCAATMMNVYTLNLHNRGLSNKAQTPPPWIRRWVLGYLATALFIRINPPDSPSTLLHLRSSDVEDDDHSTSRSRRARRKVSSRDGAELEMDSLGRSAQEPILGGSPHSTPSLQAYDRSPRFAYSGLAPPSPPADAFRYRRNLSTSGAPSGGPAVTAASARLSPSSYQAAPGQTTAEKDVLAAVKSEFEWKFQRILRKVYQTIEQNEIRQAVQEERAKIMWEWKQLAEIIDRLLLWLFLWAIILTTFFILVKPSMWDAKSAPNSGQFHV